ncbi:MAG: TolC family protein [Bdellovibrionales bacterium]|nr:TolC family protein [Bdellovibrionales bacterium]
MLIRGMILFWLVLMAWSAQAATLVDLFELAKKNTARIVDKKFAEEIAYQEKRKAYSQVLPSLSASSSNVWRDQAPVGAFGEGYQHTAALTLNQALFKGGAEYYAISIAKKLPEIAKLQRVQEELVLYEQLAQLFFQTLRLQNGKNLYLEQEKTLEDRLKTLRQRAQIGRSRTTDVLAAESQLARIRAERAGIESQLIESEQNLKNLSGLETLGPLKDSFVIDDLHPPVRWEKDLMSTPQIKANELLVDNAKKEISAARGSYLPTLDANANFYLDRAGILRESKWDITLNAKWNLFNGGNDVAEKRIQALEAARLEAQLRDLKRNLRNDFQARKLEYLKQREVVKKMEAAVKLARRNYQQHLNEMNRGLVSTLDVLRILEDFLLVQRSYDQQLYQTKYAWIRLQALAGVHP